MTLPCKVKSSTVRVIVSPAIQALTLEIITLAIPFTKSGVVLTIVAAPALEVSAIDTLS